MSTHVRQARLPLKGMVCRNVSPAMNLAVTVMDRQIHPVPPATKDTYWRRTPANLSVLNPSIRTKRLVCLVIIFARVAMDPDPHLVCRVLPDF